MNVGGESDIYFTLWVTVKMSTASLGFFKKDLLILERETAGASSRKGGGEGENPQADSLGSVDPHVGLNPTTLRS